MERLLPECRPMVIALRVIVVLGLAGCSNQQGSSANPFMSPDRVPPPATRSIAPGTAAPYYPGDPVPAAQLAIPTGAAVAQMPAPPAASMSSFTNAAPAASATPPPAAVQAASASTPQPLAFGNERTVAVPTDSEDLRFAVPQPAAQQQAAAMSPAANSLAVAPQSAVIPAAYNQPAAAAQPMPAAGPVPSASENADGSPWRTPQIPGANSGVLQAQYVQPQSAQPTMLAAQPVQPMAPAQSMPVELRSVPSPTNVQMSAPTMMQPAQPTQMQAAPLQTTPPPRMRFPSWSDPTTWFTPQPEAGAAPNQQLVGYMVPGPNGTQQMVSVEQYQAMFGGGTQPAGSVANSDGFRPRGTATK